MNSQPWSHVRSAIALFEQLDQIRRQKGQALDYAGFGPRETTYQILHAEAGLKLRRYGDASNDAPGLLIVPAPIKQAYIWDLSPEISVVRRCLEQGMRVYLAEWTPLAGVEQDFGLADYADRLLKTCVAAIEAESGSDRTILAGHSLGGVLAATFACLHPRHVQAVLLLEAPLHFGADTGDFATLVAAAPDSRPIGQAFGSVPGSLLNAVSAAAAPHAFQWERYLDWSRSITNPAASRTHLRVERWAHDEFAMPGKLFADIVERLYRDDQLMNGSLYIGGTAIGPRNLKAPLLNVIDPRSTLIPPQSILPFHEAAASTSKKVLHYEGDIGVAIQHVGVLVGASAHAVIWPAIFDWLNETDVIH